jgi:hypothetical protein
VTILAQILLILAVAIFVCTPLVVFRGQRTRIESWEESQRRSIAERKTRLYQTILELDFDRDSGKISAEDHARMREESMREVLGVLKEEQALGLAGAPRSAQGSAARAGAPIDADRLEALIADYKRRSDPRQEVTQP